MIDAKIKQTAFHQFELDKSMLETLTRQLAECQAKLNTALQDAEKHKSEKEQLMDIMRTWYEKLKELEEERDIAKSGKVASEMKLQELQEQLNQKIEDIDRIRSESAILADDYNQLKVEFPLHTAEQDEEQLVAGDWEWESERRFNVKSVNCNMFTLNEEIEEVQQSKLFYLDEAPSAEELTTTASLVELPGEKREDLTIRNENGLGLALKEVLVLSKNENVNVWETSANESTKVRLMSPRALSKKVPCFSRDAKPFAVDKRMRSKAVGKSSFQTQGHKPQPILFRDGMNFQQTLALFRKLEMANPKPVEPQSLDQNMLSVLNKNRPNENGICKVHLLHTKHSGYLQVTKSNNVSEDLIKKFGHTFYVCLGILPETTNANPNEPFWAKDKSKDCCRPCLFWFENEDKYKNLQNVTKSMNVRTKEFQMSFSQLALGIIVITPDSAVDSNEEDAVARLRMRSTTGQDIIIKPQGEEMLSKYIKTKMDFVVVTKLQEEEEMFESHRFRAETEADTKKWIFNIRRFLTRTWLRSEEILDIKNPRIETLPRLKAGSSSIILPGRGSSVDDRDKQTLNLKASGDANEKKEVSSSTKSILSSDDDAPPKSSSKYRPAVGELAKAFNKKASKLKQEQRRASIRTIDPERKVRRRSQLFTYKESVKRFNQRRNPPVNTETAPEEQLNDD